MDAAYVAVHLEEDRSHWWFRGRLAVILAALRRALPPRRVRLLELGCGSGNVLASLGRFGEAVGMDAHPDLVAAGRASGLDVRAGHLPDDLGVERGWAEVVLLLDVIEHVDDDLATLRAARAGVSEGGLLVVTVPAYQWLWSGHDEVLGHRRRYTAAQLRAVVERAGFSTVRVSYFNTLLFPLLLLARSWKRLRRDRGHDLRHPAAPVNWLLEHVFAFERHFVPRVALPFGSSLLLIARR
jgi:SAM-dependent methyltransferase